MDKYEALGLLRGFALAAGSDYHLVKDAADVVREAYKGVSSDEAVVLKLAGALNSRAEIATNAEAVKEPEQVSMPLSLQETPWRFFPQKTIKTLHHPILKRLSDSPKKSAYLFFSTGIDAETVGNSLTSLRRAGVVEKCGTPGRRAEYAITEKGRQWLAALEAKAA